MPFKPIPPTKLEDVPCQDCGWVRGDHCPNCTGCPIRVKGGDGELLLDSEGWLIYECKECKTRWNWNGGKSIITTSGSKEGGGE